MVQCKANYRLKRAPLANTEADGETDVLASAPYTGGSRGESILYVCDYDITGALGVVKYLPVLTGAVTIATSPYTSNVCIDYPGTASPAACQNIRAVQCERRMCNETESLVRQAWFDAPYGVAG